ncbi:glycoside hydrolase family 18 protein [Flavihumibacter petaseus]|uniref:chitinase n=1 Tax=Flavihumibacter petaseus NBRC 106054 TaxID=1220578 RepID=A0A0E9MZK1_9BACT|nr:glycoside hydrolase family 18 protein [Flavihumibacter petaseus]GAO42826.1 putative glycosidase [Flavihumibacter petaseus NBRC 106054]
MKNIIAFLIFILPAYLYAQPSPSRKTAVIAYFMGNAAEAKKYPLDKLTHIIYSFTRLDGDTIAFHYPNQDKDFRDLIALKKQYANLRVMVSLGGWGGCEPCSPQFAKPATRAAFAASVKRFMERYGADGLDLDWEYPGIPGHPGHPWMREDVENFTALVANLRSVMGGRYELSFAAGGFGKALDSSINWKAVMPLVDRVNLMTYDLTNGYSKVTGHHTPLHISGEQKDGTDRCVDYLLTLGIPSEKIVIGAAFYARVWKDVPATGNGLYQPGVFKSMVNYKDFDREFSTANGFKVFWDEECMAPWSYSAVTKEFATYDDKQSMRAKVTYLKSKKLGGIMFWELGGDTYRNGLLDEIARTLETGK